MSYEAGYDVFELKIIRCHKCKKKMIDAEHRSLLTSFPKYYKKNLNIQLSKKDMVIRSETIEDGYYYLCINCESNMEFTCFGCKERRLKKEIKYKFGDPPDFLCKTCFKTKTAEEWDKLEDEISEEHRWDYD